MEVGIWNVMVQIQNGCIHTSTKRRVWCLITMDSTSNPVKGSDLMIGCWNFSMRVGGLKSFLLGSDLNRSFVIHHHILSSLTIFVFIDQYQPIWPTWFHSHDPSHAHNQHIYQPIWPTWLGWSALGISLSVAPGQIIVDNGLDQVKSVTPARLNNIHIQWICIYSIWQVSYIWWFLQLTATTFPSPCFNF